MPTRIGLSQSTRRLASATAIAASAVAIALGTTGCGAGQVSQTTNQWPAINGAFANLGQVQLRNVQIIYPEKDADKAFNAGGPFEVSFVINNGSDIETFRLTDIRAKQGNVALSEDVTVLPGKAVRVGTPALLLEPPATPSASASAGSSASATAPAAPSAESGPAATPGQSVATARFTDAGQTVSPGLLTDLTFVFVKVGENSIGNQTTPIGEVTVQTPVDTGTLQTRVDVPRQAEKPADQHAGEEAEG